MVNPTSATQSMIAPMLSSTRALLAAFLAYSLTGCTGGPDTSEITRVQVTRSEAPSLVPSAKLEGLFALLGDDDLENRDQAQRTILALGPDVLRELMIAKPRVEHPEAQRRLGDIVGVLERQRDIVQVVGRLPVFTLRAQQAPLGQILSALSSQAGIALSVDGSEFLDAKLTLEIADHPFWQVLEEICRVHGGLRPRWSANGATLIRESYKSSPMSSWYIGPILMGQLQWCGVSWPSDGPMTGFGVMELTLFVSTGSHIYSYLVTLEDVRGENGEVLELQKQVPSVIRWPWVFAQTGEHCLCLPISEVIGPVVAGPLAHIKGTVRLFVAKGVGQPLKIADVLHCPLPSESRDNSTRIEVTKRSRNGCRVSLGVLYRYTSGPSSNRLETDLALKVTDGKGLALKCQRTITEGVIKDFGSEEMRLTLEFEIPDAREVLDLVLSMPVDVKEMSIPFDFRSVKLGRSH